MILNNIGKMNKVVLGLLIVGLAFSACKKTKKPEEKKASIEGMVLVEAGEFTMGIDEMNMSVPPGSAGAPFISGRTEGEDAKPKHKVNLPAYYIDKYEVTYDQFLKFMPDFTYPEGQAGLPVLNVTWFQAEAYCKWLGKRLPTEAEWEKAARGTDERRYTWGNDFDVNKANLGDKLMKVGSFETDKSPYGVYDMVGSVAEWTADWYKPYPGSKFTSEDFGEKYKVCRGGSYSDSGHYSLGVFDQTIFRLYNPPEEGGVDNGFRCALSK